MNNIQSTTSTKIKKKKDYLSSKTYNVPTFMVSLAIIVAK